MSTRLILSLFLIPLISCNHNDHVVKGEMKFGLTEFSDYYTEPTAEKMYSNSVSDTFRIFKSFPKDYDKDSTKKYPLIIILDGNAYIESVVAEMKFNAFIGMIPNAILIGVGYKDFPTMDSLRIRDYTFPIGLPEYEMTVSGGADKFKKFIDEELLLKLNQQYRVDLDKSVLCGHSLGGYFSLYYLFKSIEEDRYSIKNIVSASPSLHYNHRYIFDMEKNLKATEAPLRVYISMGSEEMTDDESKGILDKFESQILKKKYIGLKLRKAEYTNFGHMDAAIPGFIKGLAYVFEN